MPEISKKNEKNAAGVEEFFGIVSRSPIMLEVFDCIRRIAATRVTVLIQGESGTGKELVARAIHEASACHPASFVALNCAAFPPNLLENELFGHERGAYTGAERRHVGGFERAQGGSILLDEISEIDQEMQAKLLRVLQEKKVRRIGAEEELALDLRIMAATNRDLFEEVKGGCFREDLYYRLHVVPIFLPPLRARREDIVPLAQHFLKIYSRKHHKPFATFHAEVERLFLEYEWPGNIRELENMIERVVVLNRGEEVSLRHLPKQFVVRPSRMSHSKALFVSEFFLERPFPTLEEIERSAIEAALSSCGGDVREVARQLRVGQATLYRKIKKFGIRRERPNESKNR